MDNFKENVSEWIKKLHAEITQLKSNQILITEIDENTNHNYELIQELRFEIEELKKEMNVLKIILIAYSKKTIIT